AQAAAAAWAVLHLVPRLTTVRARISNPNPNPFTVDHHVPSLTAERTHFPASPASAAPVSVAAGDGDVDGAGDTIVTLLDDLVNVEGGTSSPEGRLVEEVVPSAAGVDRRDVDGLGVTIVALLDGELDDRANVERGDVLAPEGGLVEEVVPYAAGVDQRDDAGAVIVNPRHRSPPPLPSFHLCTSHLC
ncbi:unnamed protein product, partial [Musa textilis]